MTKRWKPEISEKYWYLTMFNEVRDGIWEDITIERKLFDSGNCFETEEEAKAVAEKVNTLLLDSHEQPTVCSQLPGLAPEVFNRPDCPEWAKWAAVNSKGTLIFFGNKPTFEGEDYGCWSCSGYMYKHIKDFIFDASDWQNSLIERPSKDLPCWCKVGELVYYIPFAEYCKIEQMDSGFMLRFTNGDSTAIPAQDACNLALAHLRPYNADELRGLVGKVVTNAEGNDYLCTAFNRATDNSVDVVDIDTWVCAKYMLEHGYTINGKPCGVLEHFEKGEWVE